MRLGYSSILYYHPRWHDIPDPVALLFISILNSQPLSAAEDIFHNLFPILTSIPETGSNSFRILNIKKTELIDKIIIIIH